MIHSFLNQASASNIDWRDLVDILIMTILIYQLGLLLKGTRALQTLLRLTSLLRGVLRSEGEFTTLGRELDIIEAYLDIERARFEQRLRVSIDVPARLRHIRCSRSWRTQ